MTRNHERDHEVLQAFVKTSRDLGKKIEISFGHHQISLSYDEIDTFLAILNALPEPQDGFQRGGVILDADNVRKGDRVRIEMFDGNAHEFNVRVNEPYYIASKHGGYAKNDIERVYLIDRPVTHPDPEQHPVIYVKDCDLVNFIPEIMVWYRDSYVAGRQCLSPERITDWQQIDPAKVVADNDH